MINVSEALNIVEQNTQPNKARLVEISTAVGLVLAEDIVSPIDLPLFDQSAMDGFATKVVPANTKLIIIEEVPAGSVPSLTVTSNECIRIFTGSPIPEGTENILIQEKAEVTGNTLLVQDYELKTGKHIRKQGEQLKKGDIALVKNTLLTPAAIGFLAEMGFEKVQAYSPPKVAIVSTGNELKSPGEKLDFGQKYNSNVFALSAVLKQTGIPASNIQTYITKDTEASTKQALTEALTENDVVLITGGISVGKYDLVGDTLLSLGVEQSFYKVSQKPGKPLFYGKKKDKHVFALPGNPASALACFYVYAFPCVNKLLGRGFKEMIKSTASLSHETTNNSPRDFFQRALVQNEHVTILEGQDSAMMQSFARANCFAFIPKQSGTLTKNTSVDILLIPQ